MEEIYGNYNPSTGSATAPTPKGAAGESSYFTTEQVNVHPFFTSPVPGNPRKIFLLTYAAPIGQDFGCHMCAPLIGAFEFSFRQARWTVTASSKAALVFGQWGHPPGASKLKIGPHRYGIELEDTYSGQGEHTQAFALLAPWEGTFGAALTRWLTDEDSGMCGPGGDLPCYANHKKMKLVKGANADYFDILLTLSGTEMTQNRPFRTRPVSGVERLQFVNGRYKRLFRTGDIPEFEKDAEKSTSD